MSKSLRVSARKVKTKLPEAGILLDWYDRHRRVMPWRAGKGEVPDPYRVWLSEIMLQQTTVATVGPYFGKFIRRWPTLPDLAKAKLDDILRLWAGLGYYRRAKLLHACAKKVKSDFGTAFPQDEKILRELPGFGPYTAAAVAAIAFDKRANVVDGNVERVMARLFAVATPLPSAKEELRAHAARLLPEARYGDYAQAVMDLGATVCTPRSPKCLLCPWCEACRGCAENIQETLPRRAKALAKPVRRAIAFAVFDPKGNLLLRRRPPRGLLASMMEVPSSPWAGGKPLTLEEAQRFAPTEARWTLSKGIVRHVFSHFTLEVSVATAVIRSKAVRGHWTALENLKDEALPSVMRKIVDHALKSLPQA